MRTDEETDGRRARGGRRRTLLIESVLRVVARDGVAGVSHRSVAAEAGVSKSAVSYHFATLDDLLTAALTSHTEQLVAAMPLVPAGGDLRWFADELVRLFLENRDRVIAGYELYLLAARRPGLRAGVQPWLDLLTGLARHHTGDAARVQTCVAAIDGYFVQHLARGGTPDPDELERLLRTALR